MSLSAYLLYGDLGERRKACPDALDNGHDALGRGRESGSTLQTRQPFLQIINKVEKCSQLANCRRPQPTVRDR